MLCFNVTNMSEVCNKFKLIRQDKHVETFIRYMLMNYNLYDYHLSLRVFFFFFTWVFLIKVSLKYQQSRRVVKLIKISQSFLYHDLKIACIVHFSGSELS